jgi:hypothetical protein
MNGAGHCDEPSDQAIQSFTRGLDRFAAARN